MIDVRMVATRQFGACFLVMLATGAILLATTQFLPQLVQEDFGYTATWAGLVLSPGGVVTMVMMFVVGRLSGKVQPKYLIIAGAAVIGAVDVCADQCLRRSRLLVLGALRACCLRLGLPLDLRLRSPPRPMTAFRPTRPDQASALINAARNTGGSIGVSLLANVLAHREQFHQNRLVEHACRRARNIRTRCSR